MLFLFEMKKPPKLKKGITDLEKKFCRSLREWYDANHIALSQKEFGKKIGVSQPTVAAIFAERKCPKEDWRRWVSGYVGIPYDVMVGVAQDAKPAENMIQFPETVYRHSEYDFIRELIKEVESRSGADEDDLLDFAIKFLKLRKTDMRIRRKKKGEQIAK